MMSGGCNSHHTSDFEKCSSNVMDEEIETFINKVDAVKAAIQAMKARSQTITKLDYTEIFIGHTQKSQKTG